MASPSSRQSSSLPWPPNPPPSYRPTLIAAMAASAGISVGSLGPWATVVWFTINGLDAGWFGVTALTAGVFAAALLALLLLWSRTTLAPRWSVPLTWLAAVLGVGCLAMSLPFLIRVMTSPRTDFFGVPIGPGVGWGLWLLTLSSAVLAATATVLATQIATSVDLLAPIGQSESAGTQSWRWTAIIISALIVLASIVYFATNWTYDAEADDDSSGPLPSVPSFSLPSFPDFTTPSFPDLGTTPRPTTTTTTSFAYQALPQAVVGGTCRAGSTPTIDFDGVEVTCARVSQTDWTVWSRIPGVVPRPESPNGDDAAAAICVQQTGASLAVCANALEAFTYLGDGRNPP